MGKNQGKVKKKKRRKRKKKVAVAIGGAEVGGGAERSKTSVGNQGLCGCTWGACVMANASRDGLERGFDRNDAIRASGFIILCVFLLPFSLSLFLTLEFGLYRFGFLPSSPKVPRALS
ncbi:hypothetical protein CIPAW_07G153800 [Carya illinoinensis]|uniref:Transmembrane protein n=1 Tax=Carya illinoinensis TaxID=32201 RepID=A0A8T1Q5Q5_CARIL|nr:hypothetical protein CIPAW_07G153800 [Carya illinoinensis]